MATRLEKTIFILFAGVVGCGLSMCVWVPAGIAFACNGLLGWAMGEVNATPADDRLAAGRTEARAVPVQAGHFTDQDKIIFHGEVF